MARTGPTYAAVRSALHEQYGVLVAAFADLDPTAPTDCEGWTVEDLETHVAVTARGLVRIATQETTGPADGGGVNDWAAKLPGLAEEVDEMTRAERLSLAPLVDQVEAVLASTAEDKVVEQLTGRHTLKDAAVFRLIEAVVHGLDVGITPAPTALKIVVKELAQVLADRYPGHSVEVRVSPYAAVQCLPGPRHTRGPPPNVVEAEPIAFVRLCSGRQAWDDLTRSGWITASGERSDLSALMPVLA